MITKKLTNETHTDKSTQSLLHMGWNDHFQAHLDQLCNGKGIPARVIGVRKNSFLVSQGEKEWTASVAGKLNYRADGLYPVTGDWVLTADTVILAVLPRENSLSRGAAGTRGKQEGLATGQQFIAANLDTVFIVCGMDRDFNLRRIERYLTLVFNCKLNPVIILTKADLLPDPGRFKSEVETVAFKVPVHLVSAHDSQGLAPLETYLSPGRTIAMVGSSGAGKSTLVNRLSGKPIQTTQPISRHVGKGTHTTTARDLIQMPQGGMIIDNPGIREIALWDNQSGINAAFPEIEALAGACRFFDCSHVHEPGCRVLHAISTGELSPNRLESYKKMKQELSYLSQRQNKSADRVEKERWKKVAMKIKEIKKRKDR